MKNNKYALPLVLITTVFLTACAYLNPTENTQITSTELPGQTEVSSDMVQGDKAPQTAMQSRYGQTMKCDLLKGANARQACETQTQDMIGMMLESEIINSFDVSRCKIFTEQMASECEKRIADTGVKGPVSEEEQALFNQAMQPIMPTEPMEGPMVLTYDSAKCGELKADGYKAYCEKMVLQRMDQEKLMDIVSSGELKRCDELKDNSMKEQCKMLLAS